MVSSSLWVWIWRKLYLVMAKSWIQWALALYYPLSKFASELNLDRIKLPFEILPCGDASCTIGWYHLKPANQGPENTNRTDWNTRTCCFSLVLPGTINRFGIRLVISEDGIFIYIMKENDVGIVVHLVVCNILVCGCERLTGNLKNAAIIYHLNSRLICKSE